MLVEVAATDGIAGVTGGREHAADRFRCCLDVEPDDLDARCHDRAHGSVGDVHDPLDHLMLDALHDAGLRAFGEQAR